MEDGHRTGARCRAIRALPSSQPGRIQNPKYTREELVSVRTHYVVFCLFLMALFVPLATYGHIQATTTPSSLALADPNLLGMAIRDPWYEFGTFPGQPGQPNRAAQDAMGANLTQLGVRWVRFEFHIEGSDVYSITQVARNDYFISEVAPRYGLMGLGLLSFALMHDQPPQALAYTDTLTTDPIYGGCVNDYMRGWVNRARMIADRYGSQIQAYEILN